MNSLVRQLVDWGAARFGYVVLPLWRAEQYPQVRWLQRLFGRMGIDGVLDVGANRGQYRDFLRRVVGYRGRIVSVEPLPHLGAALRERAADDPLWGIEECALGEQSGRLKLQVMAQDQFSSFRAPDETGTTGFAALNRPVATTEVEVRTLAELMPSLQAGGGFGRPYLKLDTQGYDLNVLRGAEPVLGTIVALQTEAAVVPIYKDSPRYDEVIKWLERRGFELSGIFPNNPHHFPRLLEFDCHVINGRFVDRAKID